MSAKSAITRAPAVAGRFYPAEPGALWGEVARLLEAGADGGDPAAACAVMAPHAGYVYSGGIAGQVFARLADVPERVIILAPNHTGRGARVAVVTEGAFELPGRAVPVDEALAAAVLAESPLAERDREAHRDEHAVEVELPFLVARQPALRIVPIVIGALREDEALALGRALHRAAAAAGGPVLVVASSDMSHYLPDDEARAVDQVALEPLLAFDPARLYRTVRDQDISMCGVIPTTVMLAYAREAGAGAPELCGYATSGDAFGDRSRVVGYAGVIVPTRAAAS
jgi:MEMO1 family protein